MRFHNSGTGGVQHLFVSVPTGDLTPIELLKELLFVAGNQFDQFVVQGLAFRERLGFADRLFR